MGKARGEGARFYVIYSAPLAPLDGMGWPLERAFAELLEQCGYEAVWGDTTTATLTFRHAEGPHKGVPVGILSPVDHPKVFSQEMMRGNNADKFARETIMCEVLRTGLNGWRGQTRDSFTITSSMAEHRKRNSERFPPSSK